MLLKLNRWAKKAIGNSEDNVAVAEWIGMQTRQGKQLQISIVDYMEVVGVKRPQRPVVLLHFSEKTQL